MSDNWEITDEEFFTVETGNNEAEAEEMAELADGYQGYLGLEFHWYAQQVADRIYNIHAAREVNGEFVFSLTCNADGEIDGCVVNLSIPHSGFYLVRSIEWKHMTDDRGATGRDGILAIKHALLDYEYALLRRYAIENTLLRTYPTEETP
jgi:hypothetical protein